LRIDDAVSAHTERDLDPFDYIAVQDTGFGRYGGNQNVAVIDVNQIVAADIQGVPCLLYGECSVAICYVERGVFGWVYGSRADGNRVSTTGVCGDGVIVENAGGDRGFRDIFKNGC
jgi:hypothetical protein